MQAACNGGEPWSALVRRLETALENAADGDEEIELSEIAEEVSGLSHVMWKRFRTALARTERIAREARIPLEHLLSASFSSQEVALRIHDRSPLEGLETLASTATGDLRLADLRERLSHLPDPKSGEVARAAVVRAKSAGRSLVHQSLEHSTVHLWGRGSRILRRPRLRYMSDGFEVIARDGTVAAGVDVADVGVRTNRDALMSGLSLSLLTASFFPRFYLACLATGSGGAADRAADVLAWLGAASVGVVAVRRDGTVDMVRSPSGPPLPDRTARYEAAKRRFSSSRPDDADEGIGTDEDETVTG